MTPPVPSASSEREKRIHGGTRCAVRCPEEIHGGARCAVRGLTDVMDDVGHIRKGRGVQRQLVSPKFEASQSLMPLLYSFRLSR
jgi:hypothetical protein